eukprot:gnl/TRDRNA2_/TRDRNA2_84566_c0_seq1.p1 gnl/TRDRNA2_/TRDRNA2_84566_c0~~gnl/TRDRNA2_/TRDRNA2_84566_c0_seq1.p1  ORF type:complete len:137 (-),score=27.52 gnl/TRDRNA2_/TRDRNA2_84566_c0_seq1:114-476(-)
MARFGLLIVAGLAAAALALDHKVQGTSVNALKEEVSDLKKANPLFAEDTCTTMFETMKKLGGSVPPNEVVNGCVTVCEAAKKMKEYGVTSDASTFACDTGKAYGCVFPGTPPTGMAELGC